MAQLTKTQLKELADKVIVAQGNFFIKELLRSSGAVIGTRKEDFVTNLNAAIDTDIITQDILENWLAEVEGWGDQHLYLVEPPQVDTTKLAGSIGASRYADTLNAAASLDFPDDLVLKHTAVDDIGLSMVWHQRKEGWNRWRARDYVKNEETDVYRFEAYRQRFDRSIVRFEWRFDRPYCGILIHRNTDIDHKEVFEGVRAVLAAIGCPDITFTKILLSQAVKAASTNGSDLQQTRFEIDSGYVELASTLPEGGIDEVEPVRLALRGVDMTQFDKAQGMLHFSDGLSRRIAVQVFGNEGRLRIWSQCKREDVFQILRFLWDYNESS